ncbi:hypothetical protein [Fluviicola sp.]|uniref:hypothetical protein n=1 Tax=Fluviicola sp. TaxID=1917219 RepID=UPI0031E3B10E
MKQLITITSLLILAISLPGCKRKLFDYRNKYIGNYQLTYDFHYWEMGGITKDTSVVYKGKVKYGEKGSVKIDWYDGSEYIFDVSKKGAISKCNQSIGTMERKHFELSFTDDVCGTGPMGSNYTVTLSGNKE